MFGAIGRCLRALTMSGCETSQLLTKRAAQGASAAAWPVGRIRQFGRAQFRNPGHRPMRERMASVAVLVMSSVALAGCSGMGGASRQASCAVGTVSAPVIFEGEVLPGPTGSVGGSPVVLSPARVNVIRYVKGTGPGTVTVATGATGGAGAVTVIEDGILPGVHQFWEIYATTAGQPFQTSICAGSHQVSLHQIQGDSGTG